MEKFYDHGARSRSFFPEVLPTGCSVCINSGHRFFGEKKIMSTIYKHTRETCTIPGQQIIFSSYFSSSPTTISDKLSLILSIGFRGKMFKYTRPKKKRRI